jgi:hypothetical protein
MTIVPAQEEGYRRKTRRRLTLDLFTRYGTFWTLMDALRDGWGVSPTVAVPPEPAFHAEVVGLLTRYQMPERFHMPTTFSLPRLDFEALEALDTPSEIVQYMQRAEARLDVGLFLKSLADVWKREIARPHEKDDDWRSGANVAGWMSWAPFLSACVLYDPPADRLLEFADHDDRVAAALWLVTVSQDGDIREEAALHKAAFLAGDHLAILRYSETLRRSFYESDAPRAGRLKVGKPRLDDLESVQAAIWQRQGLTHLEAAERGGWTGHPDNQDRRDRKNRDISRVKRGNAILASRGYSG